MTIVKNSKYKVQSTNKIQSTNPKRATVFDLEERMSKFSESVIQFCQSLKVNHISKPLVSQLVRSATSIGANYCEANNASSQKDFRNKVHIAKKEAQETKYWLRMLKTCYHNQSSQLNVFWQEAHELTLILQAIITKVDGKV